MSFWFPTSRALTTTEDISYPNILSGNQGPFGNLRAFSNFARKKKRKQNWEKYTIEYDCTINQIIETLNRHIILKLLLSLGLGDLDLTVAKFLSTAPQVHGYHTEVTLGGRLAAGKSRYYKLKIVCVKNTENTTAFWLHS